MTFREVSVLRIDGGETLCCTKILASLQKEQTFTSIS